MSAEKAIPRRETSGPVHVRVLVDENAEPIDLDVYAGRLVRTILEHEGIVPVAAPPVPPLR